MVERPILLIAWGMKLSRYLYLAYHFFSFEHLLYFDYSFEESKLRTVNGLSFQYNFQIFTKYILFFSFNLDYLS